MQTERILITGAAGNLGSTSRETIRILLEQGRSVRAMVRTLDERAESLRAMGAEIVVADMLDIQAVRAAMQDCAVVYFNMSISPSYLEAATNMAVVAKSLGVTAFVNVAQMTLSQMSDTETTTSTQQRQHWLGEQMLRWSGLPVVYLRPTAFFDGLFLALAANGIREENAIKLPFCDGKTAGWPDANFCGTVCPGARPRFQAILTHCRSGASIDFPLLLDEMSAIGRDRQRIPKSRLTRDHRK